MERLYEYYGRLKRIERIAPSVAATVWKIYRIAKPNMTATREILFSYDNRYFSGRYNRSGRGYLEVVEIVGKRYEKNVCTISNLVEALTLDMKDILDTSVHNHTTPLVERPYIYRAHDEYLALKELSDNIAMLPLNC